MENFEFEYADLAKTGKAICINNRLKMMYEKWLNEIDMEKLLDAIGKEKIPLVPLPDFLICTDKYLADSKKIMTVGKEGNSKVGDTENKKPLFCKLIKNNPITLDGFYMSNNTDAYSYTCNVAAVKTKKWDYLKHRLSIINKYDFTEGKYIGYGSQNNDFYKNVIELVTLQNNNLNKISIDGKAIPLTANIELTKSFEFENKEQNVFMHEIDIMKPTHIILWCGKNYNNQIKNAFGRPDIYEDNITINDIEKLCSKTVKIKRSDDKTTLIKWFIHPSCRRLNRSQRIRYNKDIQSFLNEPNI